MAYLELILIISLASLGVRAITDKGKLLYLCRKPFDDIEGKMADIVSKSKEYVEENTGLFIDNLGKEGEEKDRAVKRQDEISVEMRTLKSRIRRLVILNYLGKPLVTCSTCMASVWTAILFPLLVGAFDSRIFVVALGVAFVNTILWALTQLIVKNL